MGMRYEIDLGNVRSKEQFHDKIQDCLPCPSCYGKNLDALYDVLTEQSEPWELVFQNYGDFAHDMPGYANTLKMLCEDVMAECPNLNIRFEG